jgi:general secretion pathway protein I
MAWAMYISVRRKQVESGSLLMIDYSKKNAVHGFTLIEIMVALIIFAVLAVTLSVRLGDSIRSEQYLESKTLASILAENVLADMRIEEEWSNVRSSNKTVNIGEQRWEIATTVTDTANENIRQVYVQVGPDTGRSRNESYVFSLTSFIGRY